MICYKDMTFCPYWEDCKEKDCPRALTPDVCERANDIGLPICEFANKPDCWEE